MNDPFSKNQKNTCNSTSHDVEKKTSKIGMSNLLGYFFFRKFHVFIWHLSCVACPQHPQNSKIIIFIKSALNQFVSPIEKQNIQIHSCLINTAAYSLLFNISIDQFANNIPIINPLTFRPTSISIQKAVNNCKFSFVKNKNKKVSLKTA